MKLLITENPPAHQWDGLVISPEKGDNFKDLDKFVDSNECSDILFTLTDYVPTNQLNKLVEILTTKLAHKGKLTIIGTDAIKVAQSFNNGSIDVLEFNKLIYGSRDKVWAFKQGLVSLNDIVFLMKLYKLKILTKRLSDHSYSVTGERE